MSLPLLEPTRQFSSADFSALVYRNGIDDEDSFRHLPRAQPVSAEFQDLVLAKIDIHHHTGGHFFVAESRACGTSKRNRPTNAYTPSQHFSSLLCDHLFSCPIDNFHHTYSTF